MPVIVVAMNASKAPPVLSRCLTNSHKCHIKHSLDIREWDHTLVESQFNTDYNMVSENAARCDSSKVHCANGASLEAKS